MNEEHVLNEIALNEIVYKIKGRNSLMNDYREINRDNIVQEIIKLINSEWNAIIRRNDAECKLEKIESILKGEEE